MISNNLLYSLHTANYPKELPEIKPHGGSDLPLGLKEHLLTELASHFGSSYLSLWWTGGAVPAEKVSQGRIRDGAHFEALGKGHAGVSGQQMPWSHTYLQGHWCCQIGGLCRFLLHQWLLHGLSLLSRGTWERQTQQQSGCQPHP